MEVRLWLMAEEMGKSRHKEVMERLMNKGMVIKLMSRGTERD